MAVPWETINEKLPFQRNKDAYDKRKDMWTAMDVNGNGYLSLAEVTKGVRDVIAVDELFDAIPAINRSFHHVKAVAKSENPHGDDFIQWPEFRLFLQTLRQFFEYYEAFSRLDAGEDQRVDKEEFTSDKMKETIEKVNVVIVNSGLLLLWYFFHKDNGCFCSGWAQWRTWELSLTRLTRTEADRSCSQSSWTGRWRRTWMLRTMWSQRPSRRPRLDMKLKHLRPNI